jgi:hypothetical protein
MIGSCRRLLTAFSLIFVASMFLYGQDTGRDRAAVLAPNLAPSLYTAPNAPARGAVGRYPVGRDPVGRDPVAPGPIVFQQPVFQQLIFQQLVHAAGIIFSGRVTFIGRAASTSGQDAASTAVTFQVEHAMRGASAGQNLTIHEWAGLWNSGERYHVGERMLLFLYSPGKLGLTSPVAGALGRFAMDSQGKIVMSAEHVQALAADPILGGKTVVPYTDFALAVRRSSGEE